MSFRNTSRINKGKFVFSFFFLFLFIASFAAYPQQITYGDFVYSKNSENRYVLLNVEEGVTLTGIVEVPATFNYNNEEYIVIGISGEAFKGQNKMTKLVVNSSQSITKEYDLLSNFANGCSALEEVELPDNLAYITKATFNGCTNLKKLYINAVKCPVIAEGASGYDNSLPAGATLYVPEESVETYKSNSFFAEVFGTDNIMAIGDTSSSTGHVRLNFRGAVFELPHMATTHQIVYTLPEGYIIKTPENEHYTVDNSTNTITINSIPAEGLDITPVSTGLSDTETVNIESGCEIRKAGNTIEILGLNESDSVEILLPDGAVRYQGLSRKFTFEPGVYIINTPVRTWKIRI